MSGGTACRCSESKRPAQDRRWQVLQRNGNRSAFNGYRFSWSKYSAIRCPLCHMVWRTTGRYVNLLKDITPEQREAWALCTEDFKPDP